MARIPPGGIIVFDAVGTLLRPEPAVAEAYASAGRDFGSRLTRAEIDSLFQNIFSVEKALDLRRHQGRTDEERERERWRSIVSGIFDDVAPALRESLFEVLWQHFAEPKSWRTFDDVGSVLPRLVRAGHVVAIASNFDSRLLPIVAALIPEIPSERIFVSSIVGYRKPAQEFYRACEIGLANLERNAGPLYLIGDDYVEDYSGAKRAGWNSILLDRDDRRPSRYIPRIRSLSELA